MHLWAGGASTSRCGLWLLKQIRLAPTRAAQQTCAAAAAPAFGSGGSGSTPALSASFGSGGASGTSQAAGSCTVCGFQKGGGSARKGACPSAATAGAAGAAAAASRRGLNTRRGACRWEGVSIKPTVKRACLPQQGAYAPASEAGERGLLAHSASLPRMHHRHVPRCPTFPAASEALPMPPGCGMCAPLL